MTRGSDTPYLGPAAVRPARGDPPKVSLRRVSRRRCPAPTVGGMATPQIPVNSGFTADSTVAEVLAGVELTGKLAIVTGGYSGIGTAVTRALSEAGATVVMPARRPDQVRKELGDVARAEIAELDLAGLRSVESFADGFLASGRAPRAKPGPRPPRSSRGWAASTSNAATSRRSPRPEPTRGSRKKSSRTRSTRRRPRACEQSPPSSPMSTRSPRPEP
jgi:hypothetical protein